MSAASASSQQLPSLAHQAENLVALGIAAAAGLATNYLESAVQNAGATRQDALLAIRQDLAPASVLAPLLRRDDKAGFVVQDMTDVDRFTPYRIDVPDSPIYLVHGPDRGDDWVNYTPEEALPELAAAGRTPLLLAEGLHWVLQRPSILERNRCFMTIGSRLRKDNGSYDARTPAVWISNGTGRDGREHLNAPKVGWCWWRNRHTWLGFASTTGRDAPAA